MEELYEKTIKSELIYKGRILNLRVDQVLLPNGKEGGREVVEFSQAVTVVALTNDNQVLLVTQYRYPVEEVLVELPAGKMDAQEKPEECARRELREETGYQAGSLEKIFEFYTTPGFTNELMHVFLAKDLTPGEQCPDEDEFVQVKSVPIEEAIQMIFSGSIRDGKTIAGLLGAQQKLQS